MRKFIFIFALFLLFPSFHYGADFESNTSLEPKNPFLAGIFSWYHPGLGQFYVGETKKATIFWITENVLLFSVILNIADIKFAIKKDFGFEFSIRLKKNPSGLRIASTVGLGIVLLALHIYNIIDAIHSAQLYNQRIFAREFESISSRKFWIDIYNSEDVNGLMLVHRF